MKIVITAKDYPLTTELEDFIRQRISESMHSYSERIAKLKVSLKTVRQPNDMLDTQCCMEARIKGVQTVVVIKRSHDAQSTIQHCIHQTALSVSRVLEKNQVKRRRKFLDRLTYMRDGARVVAA